MKSRRIVLSDDEDEGEREYVLPAPASSSDLVQGIHGLNVEGAGTQVQHSIRHGPLSPEINEAYWQTGDVQFSQADGNLDAENTVRVMHGTAHTDDEEEEFDFEDEERPKLKTKLKHNPGKDLKANKKEGKPPSVSASGRPRRAAAARAEEQLHQLYSEHDMRATPQQDSGDAPFSDGNASDSGESSSSGSAGSGNLHGAEGDTQDGDDSASDVLPRRRRSASASVSASGTSSGPSSGARKLHSASAQQREASPSAPSRRQSTRTMSLSSRKEQQFQKARDDMKLKASGGLDAVLQSSSDSGEGEGYPDSDGDVIEQRSPPRGSSSSAKGKYQEPCSPTGFGRPSGTASGRRNEPKTRYSFSVSKNRSPKATAKGFAHWRDEREADIDAAGDSEESDINDFIVNSDEERAEEEERAAAAALRREQRRQQKRAGRGGLGGSGSRARDVIAAATARYERGAAVAPMDSEEEDNAPTRGSSRKSATMERHSADDPGPGSSRKRRLVVASSDEDEHENSAQRGRKRRNAGTASGVVDLTGDGDSEGEEAEMDDGSGMESGMGSGEEGSAGSGEESSVEDSEGDEGSEGSDSELDGPMLYHKVNSMLDQRQGRGEEIATIASMRKRFPVEEAVQYYVLLLAHVLVDPDFLDDCLRYRSGAGAGGRRGNSSRDRAKQQKEDREAVLRASNYLSASRQIENLLCTARESLLGSGAWNKEFYSELQARPFYQSVSTAMCIGSSSARKGRKRGGFDAYGDEYGDEYGDSGSAEEEEVVVKCAACNRSTQQPDIQVFLFGSRYDARSVWDTERWDRHMPEELFLYPQEQGEEGYMHEAGSNINTPRYSSPRSASGSGFGSGLGSGGQLQHSSGGLALSVRRNKQFQGYQTLMSSGLKRYGDSYTVRGGGGGGRGSGAKGRLQPDEALVGSWQARQARLAEETRSAAAEGGRSGSTPATAAVPRGAGDKAGDHSEARKRKLIVLSDSEDEDHDGQWQGEGKGEGDQGGGKRSRGQSSLEEGDDIYVQERLDRETAEAEAAAEAERVRQEQEEQEERELAEEEDRVRNWWKQKFPREFTREPESVYFLSIHCKNRTRMYHTLLHYKFRLLLTIRAKLLRTANALAGTGSCHDDRYDEEGYSRRVSQGSNSSRNGGRRSLWRGSGDDSQFDTSWEQWDPEDRARLLQAALAQLQDDEVFLGQEARRFQALVKETERRYGGGDEPRHDIWGDEDDTLSATGAAKPSQQSQTILKWLNKQKARPGRK